MGEPFVGRQLPVKLQQQPGENSVTRYVDFVYQPIRDATGQVTGIFVEGSDVTETYKAQEALRAERDLSQAARAMAEAAAAELSRPPDVEYAEQDVVDRGQPASAPRVETETVDKSRRSPT